MTPGGAAPCAYGSAVDTLARTLWGEARGEGIAGMTAVANVVINRLTIAQRYEADHPGRPEWWGDSIAAICTHPAQFSCWNADDPNRAKLLAVTLDDPQFVEALALASQAVNGRLPDTTGGADTYEATALGWCKSWGANKPPKNIPTAEIGRQTFYRFFP